MGGVVEVIIRKLDTPSQVQVLKPTAMQLELKVSPVAASSTAKTSSHNIFVECMSRCLSSARRLVLMLYGKRLSRLCSRRVSRLSAKRQRDWRVRFVAICSKEMDAGMIGWSMWASIWRAKRRENVL